MNTRTRLSICNVAAEFGGTIEWTGPWGFTPKETFVSFYAMNVAAEQLELAKIATVTRRRLRTKVTLNPEPPSANELAEMSRENRYHCAQIALFRDQDETFNAVTVDLDNLDARLERLFPGLAGVACPQMINALKHDLIMATS